MEIHDTENTNNEMETEGTYRYTYRALTSEQKKETESILREYEPKEVAPQSDFERLQSLKNKIASVLTILGVSMGVIGCLIFGGGLSMILLNESVEWCWIVGGVLGIVGAAVMLATYPVYRYTERKLKDKYKEEIVRLCKNVLEK